MSQPLLPTTVEPPPAGRYSFTVEDTEAGQRLDRFLSSRLAGMSRSRIKQLIEEGAVSSGDATIVEASTRVKSEQSFAIEIPEVREAQPEPQPLALSILYEDDHLIVVDKPAGLVVHPGPGNPDRTLVNALIAHCGMGQANIGGEGRPGIVHRLDKDTSGVMVVAKREEALHDLIAQFAERSIGRSYLALVWGRPRPPEGEIRGCIGRSPRNRKKMAVLQRGGKEAITLYRTLKDYGEGTISLLECRLLTGRTHQIRVHLTDRGHPLLGDRLYGRGIPKRGRELPARVLGVIEALRGQALQAKSLAFRHPQTGARLQFEAPLPTELENLTGTLESL